LHHLLATVILYFKYNNENIILEKVRLEELYVRRYIYRPRSYQIFLKKYFRRYIGQYFPKLAKIITANAKTLRVIGKIGLTEAIEGFNEHVRFFTL